VQMNLNVQTTITAIQADASMPIQCLRVISDDRFQRWASDAAVAKTTYAGFISTGRPITDIRTTFVSPALPRTITEFAQWIDAKASIQ
jgi:hypothetical protein